MKTIWRDLVIGLDDNFCAHLLICCACGYDALFEIVKILEREAQAAASCNNDADCCVFLDILYRI